MLRAWASQSRVGVVMGRPGAGLLAGAAALVLLLFPRPCAAEGGFAFEAGYFDMTNARNSAKAVFGGSAGGVTFGTAGRFDLKPRWFVGAAVRYFQRDGERVFVADPSSEPFRLGHPLKVRVIPIYAFGGYRFASSGSSLVPYAGLGVGATMLHEESTVAELTDSADQTKAAFHLIGGVEYGRGSLRFGVELTYSLVPNSIGVGGVSQVYGESDIGGLSAVARILLVP
jgi:opacity protein-like surface antigen